MDGLRGYYAKWNKSEKDKYNIISVIYRIWKKKRTNIKKQTQIQRTNWWLPERDEEMKEIGKGDVEIQTLI